MKENHDEKDCLPNGKRERSKADQRDLGRPPGDREHFLAEVESQRGGGVQIEIGVMDHVETPE